MKPFHSSSHTLVTCNTFTTVIMKERKKYLAMHLPESSVVIHVLLHSVAIAFHNSNNFKQTCEPMEQVCSIGSMVQDGQTEVKKK